LHRRVILPLPSLNGARNIIAAFVIAALFGFGCGSGDEEGSRDPTPTTTVPTTPIPDRLPTPELTEAPPEPTATPAPILVGAGDIAACTQENDTETAALLDTVVSSIPGEVVVFTAGDNVYEYGAAEEFAQCYDPTWGRHKGRTRPAPGNHDYATAGGAGYFGYFGEAAGERGKGYYSYDLGSWHVIVLNTGDHCRSILCGPGSPQEAWLRADLAASTAPCTVAIWHDPLFSSGVVHGSKRYVQPLWDALYQAGAEIVLNGHEHNYERFAPQTPAGEADPNYGIRQFVVGTGGESHYREGDLLPNSEAADGQTYGILKLTLHALSYDWEFIPLKSGQFSDRGSGRCHGPPAG
jgi:hypothetical protein